jgi:putative toxin-antitoxin system antitoxin component (TIGR02293 family)
MPLSTRSFLDFSRRIGFLPIYLGKITHMPKITRGNPQPSSAHSKTMAKVAQLLSQGLTREEIKWELLGGKLFSPRMPTTAMEFYDAVSAGVPKLSVDNLADVMDIPMTVMAKILNLSYKTLTRKNKKDLLDRAVSSHTYEMSDIIARGFEVFENGAKLNRWLHKENRALKGKKPFDLLHSPTGIRLVGQVLGRLEEGVYS